MPVLAAGLDRHGPERAMDSRALVRIALFAAIIAVLGLLPKFDIPLAGGVPVTAQTLGVMLAGLVLGAGPGALSVLLFLFVVALGAPLLAGGRGGLGVFFTPSAGFLIGWVAGAFVCGWLMDRLRALPALPGALVAATGGGVIAVYAFGVPVLAWKTGLSFLQALAATAVFLPGDLLKVLAAALVVRSMVRASPSKAAIKR